jgi:hypothetical protein
MTSTIGRPHDAAALTTLHRPANAQQIEDARHAARQALAALRAIDPAAMRPDDWTAAGRCASALGDVIDELERIGRHA